VAPMMAHTNRHYHAYFRFFSQHAHLYSEMIPADAIINIYNENKNIESNEALQELLGIHHSFPSDAVTTTANYNENHGGITRAGPVILQLGGRDPQNLALASEIGVRMGYDGINLNCGCPSNAVSGRSGGCAMMRDASHVAECVERMSESIRNAEMITHDNGVVEAKNEVQLSVKHRLGVRDASTYDADRDKGLSDDEAYFECEEFVRAITKNSNVSKLQVHARLGLLGDFTPERTAEGRLWTPNSADQLKVPGGGDDSDGGDGKTSKKIDHKREQYKAKKLARKATIHNRSVPPLRPDVVNRLAERFPHLEFVTNGGIKSTEDMRRRIDGTNVAGAMVGRSVINHPCSFSRVDGLWDDATTTTTATSLPQWTREDVIQSHIQYCIREEERCKHQSDYHRELLRRRLVAVPFSLFAGEDGNNAYQRTVRKLGKRLKGRHMASSVLLGALTHVPMEVREKPITEFASLDSIESYSEYTQRSGTLQRAIL